MNTYIIVFIFLTFISQNLFSLQREGYCIQVITSQSEEKSRNVFSELSDFPLSRVEKIGKYYTVRIGLFENPEEAKDTLKEVRKYFPQAILRKCTLKDERIILIKRNEKNKNENEREIVKSFKELGILSDDIILRGVYPSWSFFLPVYDGFKGGEVNLFLRLSPGLRRDSYVEISVNDKPIARFSADKLPYPVRVKLPADVKSDFIKVGINGYLRYGNTLCEDTYENRTYLLVEKESKVIIRYRDRGEIYHVFYNYNPIYSLEQSDNLKFFSLAFYLSKYLAIPAEIYLDGKKGFRLVYNPNIEGIERIGNKVLVSDKFIDALNEGFISATLLGKRVEIKRVVNKTAEGDRDFITLSEMGYDTLSSSGIGFVSLSFKFNYTYAGGIPENPRLRIHLSNTPVKEDASINVYVNGKMINSFSVKEAGEKSYDIPLYETTLGDNIITLVLNDFISADECKGNVPRDELTLFNDSYIYWTGVKKNVDSVSDLVKLLNGKVLVYVGNDKYLPFVVKFLSELGRKNKNVVSVELTRNPANVSEQKYDFLVSFGDVKGSKQPIKYDKGGFKIMDPLTGRVVFSSDYTKDFLVVQVGEYGKLPALNFQCFGDCSNIFNKTDFDQLYRIFANVGIVTSEYRLSLPVGSKLSVKYELEKDISYYWNKYKLIVLVVLGGLILIFLRYVYIRLTGRPK